MEAQEVIPTAKVPASEEIDNEDEDSPVKRKGANGGGRKAKVCLFAVIHA